VDLRLAVKYAVDRDALVQKVLQGYGKVANDHPVPDTDPLFSPDLAQRAFDPDKAKFHLKKSGYDGKIVLTVSDGAFAGAVQAGEIIQDSAAKAGIDIALDRAPADGYWDNVWMKVPFCASYWNGRPTPDLMYSLAYKSDAPWNETYWKNEQFDTYLLQARGELDTSKRKQMYAEMQSLAANDGGELIPFFASFLDACSTSVRGFTPTPQSELSGLRAAEKIWLET
jgi:peptide/nickel transport system substrate-binding protein